MLLQRRKMRRRDTHCASRASKVQIVYTRLCAAGERYVAGVAHEVDRSVRRDLTLKEVGHDAEILFPRCAMPVHVPDDTRRLLCARTQCKSAQGKVKAEQDR